MKHTKDKCKICGKDKESSQAQYCNDCYNKLHRVCQRCGGLTDHLPENYTLCRACFFKVVTIKQVMKKTNKQYKLIK